MTYLLTWKGAWNKPKIERYIDKAAAKAALDGIENPEIGGVEVDIDIDLDYKSAELVIIFNKLAGPDDPQVTRFTSKADGQRRVFARIEDLAKGMPITDVTIPDASTTPPPEAPPSEPQQEIEMTAKTKPRKAKANGAKKTTASKAAPNGAPRKPRGATKVKVARAPRENNVTSLITKMLERDRGASKKEIKAAALEKDPKYDEVKLDNTVRGILSVMSRNTPKFKKAKDDKRGLVYSIG